MFNRIDWMQVYQLMKPGQEKQLRFQHGTGRMTLLQNTYTIKADNSTPNHIDIESDNVESMRIYLNDQMVDFSRPIIVRVNKKVRFEGQVKPSVDEMLKDQIFLGRGWRYFTGIIDIDFSDLAASTQPTTKSTTRKGTIEIVPPEGSGQKPVFIETGKN